MNRRFLSVIAMLAILFQGLSSAWAAMPSAASAKPMAAPMTMSADSQAMPCHQHQVQVAQKAPATHAAHGSCCHGVHCQCAQLCSLGVALALPMQAAAMPATRHTQSVAGAPASSISSAHKLLPIRPPITRSS